MHKQINIWSYGDSGGKKQGEKQELQKGRNVQTP